MTMIATVWAQHIAARNRPCRCMGAPINCVWLSGTRRHLIGYECGSCGHRWRIDDEQARGARAFRCEVREINDNSTEGAS